MAGLRVPQNPGISGLDELTTTEEVFVQTLAGHSYTNGQLLIGNTATGGLSFATLTQGTGVTITNGNGTITIAASASGSGTVTNTGGNLTANSVVLGAGTVDTKVSTGITTDGTAKLILGVNTTTLGSIKMFGNTSGDVTIQPTAAAGTATVQTLPATTGTLVNRVTTSNGVSASNSDGALTFTLGAITPTTVNGHTFTAGSSTFTGTAAQTYTFPTTSATLARTDAGNTFTGHQTIEGVTSTGATGTGKFVFDTSPVLVTPTLGVATATSINGNFFTAGTYTLTGQAGKTLTFNGSITLTGTDAATYTFPGASKTLAANDGSNWTIASQAIGDILSATSTTAYGRIAAVATGSVLASAGTGTAPAWTTGPQVTTIELGAATDTTLSRVSAGVIAVEGVTVPTVSSTNTFTNKRVTRRLTTTSGPGGTPTTNTDNVDVMNFTALAAAITSMTTNLSGSPVDGDLIEFRFTDNGTARAITWGASFGATTVALPTTTVISTMLRVLFEWNGTIWQCIAVA